MNIRVSDITSTSFVVHWDEVDDANQYHINWSSAGASSREVTSQTSYTITGLIPNTTYYVTITSVNSCGFFTDNYTLSVTTPMIGSPVPVITTTGLTIPNSFMTSSIITRPTGSRITLCTYCIPLTNKRYRWFNM